MRTVTKTLMTAGLVAALAAMPLSQVLAQDASASTQASSNQTVPDKAADAWITTKVKSEFAATKNIHATDISVETTEGVVTLTGTATSAKEKAKAIRVAKKVKGVKSVDANGLNVSEAGSDSSMKSDSSSSQ